MIPGAQWCVASRLSGGVGVALEAIEAFVRLSQFGEHQRPVPWCPLSASPLGPRCPPGWPPLDFALIIRIRPPIFNIFIIQAEKKASLLGNYQAPLAKSFSRRMSRQTTTTKHPHAHPLGLRTGRCLLRLLLSPPIFTLAACRDVFLLPSMKLV